MTRYMKIMMLCLVFVLTGGCGRAERNSPAGEIPKAEETEEELPEAEEEAAEEKAEEEAEPDATAEEEPAEAENIPLKAVFYGASNFGRWEELADLFPEIDAVNTAINGSTDRSQLEEAADAVYAYEPDLVFIQTATNDFSKGMGLEEVLEEKEIYYKTLKENLPGAKFVIMAPLPQPGRPAFWEDVQKVTEWIHEWCGKHEDFYCIDTTDRMLGEEGPEELLAGQGKYYDPDLFEKDGIHLNEKGRSIWEEAIGDFLEEARDIY
ncbi:MAG: hypothetical protein IIU47_04160 [Lachnospiraceae bacterium]|nr:hypothetical protein [Lachnospiraceae bacterium]MBQ4303424.1 hypothetical protein [Lachnospiraceae bacterium]MBQ5360213.1 hypothetical protein [Lachnospiraceae bacterium]